MKFSGFVMRAILALAASRCCLWACQRGAIIPTGRSHIIVGYPPGGSDRHPGAHVRGLAGKRLGQQFIVENKPGAGNNIGTEMVVKRRAGRLHAILLVNPANAINATLYKHLRFDFLRDIDPVAGFMRVPNVMEVNPCGAGQDRRRIHRLRQSQSRQDQHGLVRQRHLDPSLRRTVQDDDRREDARTCPTRARRRCSPICSAARCR